MTMYSHLLSPNLNNLPPELILNIIYCLYYSSSRLRLKKRLKNSSPRDSATRNVQVATSSTLASLSLVSKRLRRICFPLVFRSVYCDGDSRLRLFASELKNQWGTEWARCIRHLDIALPSLSSYQKANECWRLASICTGVAICSYLTDLRLQNVLLDPMLLCILSQSHSLRALSVSVSSDSTDPLMVPTGNPFSTNDWHVPPLESLRLEPPVKSSRYLIQAVQGSLKDLSLCCERRDQVLFFGSDLRITYLHFPKLECLTVEGVLFTPGSFRRFLCRHRGTLKELNIVFMMRFNLSWVVRVIKSLVGEESEVSRCMEHEWQNETGTEENEQDGIWGCFEVDRFGCVFREQRDSTGTLVLNSNSFARKGVVELGLSFPLATSAIDPLDDITPLRDIFDAECFKSLEKLALAGDPYFNGVFSEFISGLKTICVEKLPELRNLLIGWNTHCYPWGPHRLRFDYSDALSSAEGANTEAGWDVSNVGQLFVVYLANALLSSPSPSSSPLLDVSSQTSAASPVQATFFQARLGEGSACDWRTWVDAHYARAEALMADFMCAAGALETVRFYFGRLHMNEERVWKWMKITGAGEVRVVGDMQMLDVGESIARRTFVIVGTQTEYA